MAFGGTTREIPFLVAGGGGHGLGGVNQASGQAEGDHTFEKSLSDYGYLLVTISSQKLTIEMWRVSAGWQPSQAQASPFDTVTVDLAAHVVS